MLRQGLRTASFQPASPVFIVYRHDEAGLASEIETVEIVSLGLEDHGLRSHAVLNAAGWAGGPNF
jgi:hypothetical protein